MLIKIGGRRVSVLRSDCADRDCYALGFDKGTFAQGRGYTSYHRDSKGRQVELPVCATRHHNGCPSNSVCQRCWLSSVSNPDGECDRPTCGGLLKLPASERTPFVFSIQAPYIAMFRAGTKHWEYRTRLPEVRNGEFHLVYESRGSSKVVAEMKIGRIISGPPDGVWQRTGDRGGVDRSFFDAYFTWPKGHRLEGQSRPIAHAIEMEPHWIDDPLELPSTMVAPQSWSRWKGRWPLR